MKSGAVFSADRVYRYSLWRIEDEDRPLVLFIGLNPSTADETEDDPTMRRCKRFAADWDYGGFLMGNLYGFRATDPKVLAQAGQDFFGPENDAYLARMAQRATMIVAAWGADPAAAGATWYVCTLLRVAGVAMPLRCLGRTKNGSPRHPLYVKADTKPEIL